MARLTREEFDEIYDTGMRPEYDRDNWWMVLTHLDDMNERMERWLLEFARGRGAVTVHDIHGFIVRLPLGHAQ
jgi:hypothetical protein